MIKRGTPTRTDKTGRYMTEHVSVDGPDSAVHLNVLIGHVTDAGVNPADALVRSAFVSWVRPATPEELDEWDDYTRQAHERLEKWERETYARLKAKFEGDA